MIQGVQFLPNPAELLYHCRMNLPQILITIFTAGVGSLLQGITGFGLNLLAAPILIMVQPRLVPGPILVSALVLTVLMALRDHTGIDLRGVGWMAAGMLPGTALGSYLLPVLPHKLLALILGFLVLAGVLLSLVGLRFPPRRWVLFLAGLFSGLGSTLASIGAPPVALVNQDLEPKRLRATLSGYFILSAITSLLALIPAGRMGPAELKLSFWLIPGVVLGFVGSGLLIDRMSRRTVRYVLLSLSGASALILIVQQLLH